MSVIQKAVLPLDLPVLQQPFAVSGHVCPIAVCAASSRIYSAADCALSERICATATFAAYGLYLFYCSPYGLAFRSCLCLAEQSVGLHQESARAFKEVVLRVVYHS